MKRIGFKLDTLFLPAQKLTIPNGFASNCVRVHNRGYRTFRQRAPGNAKRWKLHLFIIKTTPTFDINWTHEPFIDKFTSNIHLLFYTS